MNDKSMKACVFGGLVVACYGIFAITNPNVDGYIFGAVVASVAGIGGYVVGAITAPKAPQPP